MLQVVWEEIEQAQYVLKIVLELPTQVMGEGEQLGIPMTVDHLLVTVGARVDLELLF
jgi:hypothetical protein